MKKPKKVLILGSGALQIGQAGEFDYSGSQAIKALKEEGIKTVLINPNIATVQTSEGMADKIYFYPVNAHFVEEVIKKEKPDSILLSFGGQTALNCGVELYKEGILEKYNIDVLGTPVQTIIDTEDRDLFIKRLNEIGAKTASSCAVKSVDDALSAAEKIGYPVMIRSAYTLGGMGSGVAKCEKELTKLSEIAFAYTGQILVEEYLGGWKEIEYEVVRDSCDNCITVCNMENFDPMGIHTGESIVVAPSQTLNDREYHMLRRISIDVIRHLGIVGECNIQFALNPESEEYRIIEVNARLSRSSALASKATGYPLAFIAAKLGLGYSLTELKNSITKKTTACFEPALDYVVVKVPRWDLKKFKKISYEIGSGMKSVGEVMAIGRSFEEAIQKAVRMLQVGMYGISCNDVEFDDIEKLIRNPTDKRLFAIAEALKRGYDVDKLYSMCRIDRWFLHKIENIIKAEEGIAGYKNRPEKMPEELLRGAKALGFSDKQISLIVSAAELDIRKIRKAKGILPAVKQIDTLAAEYPAMTNYLYLTYNGTEDDISFGKNKQVMVLGSGAYCIGSSVEFDWCCVNAVFALKDMGYQTVMVNYNPETVSTDYDICDRLYFDELSLETVLDIYEKENPEGIIISMGGQIPNNIALKLHDYGARVLGTSPEDIDNAEDRHKFSSILDSMGIDQPEWKELTDISKAREFGKEVGYPVLIRPSYVLSGAAMSVARDSQQLESYLKKASVVSVEHPVVISKFYTNTKELEFDAVAENGEIVIWAVSEHIENAGVHSGDATMVLPPQRTYLETIRKMKKISRMIAQRMKINGPFNIQFLAKDNMLKVIELNLRSSRSFPFVSKVMKTNFIRIATGIIMGKKIHIPKLSLDLDYVGVKAPQFSFSRLKGADPITDVEMASTGEVGCLGVNYNEAVLLSMISTGFRIPKKSILLSIGGPENKHKLLRPVKKLLDKGFKIYATDDTSKFLNSNGVKAKMVYKAHNEDSKNSVLEMIDKKEIELIINIPNNPDRVALSDGYVIRRKATDHNVPLITNVQLAKAVIDAITGIEIEDIDVKSWDEFKESY
ncbi:carbamoyl-phosphate synthase (glutamine-hydrolyzing) large subunit [Candidatus Woesearchaeota archaeon]|nr:carbamoyl-phosphate synthase (glutamine-hydrolyzing) large subunit [Candidatus Woesearchaeota archaeon]